MSPERDQNPWRDCRLAVLFPLAALALQWAFWEYLRPFVWFLFYPAVFLGSWAGGRVGGLVATCLSTLLVWFVFVPPEGSFALEDARFVASMGVFVGMGVLFSTFHERWRTATRRTELALAAMHAANEQLEVRVRDRTSELQRTNEALRESEARLRTVTDTGRVGLVIVDEQHRYRYANRAYPEILNLAATDLVGQRVADVLAPVYEEQIRPRLEQALRGERVHYELCLPAAAPGEPGRHYAVSYEPGADRSGKIAIVVVVDITERKEAEHRLLMASRQARDLQRALDEHAIVAVTDARGAITSVNDKFCAISRYAREELIGRDHRIINSGFHSKAFFRDLWSTIGAGRVWQGDLRNRAKDGSVYWVHTTIVPLLDESTGRPRQFIAIRADITERKEAEQALRESEERLRSLGDNLPDSYVYQYTHDAGGRPRFLYLSAGVRKLHGLRPEDVLHDAGALQRQMSAEQLDALTRAEADSLRTMTDFEMELCVRVGEGTSRWLHLRSHPRRRADGQVFWDGVATDVTERRRSEEAVLAGKAKLEAALASMTDAVFISDRDGRFLDFNDAFATFHRFRGKQECARTLAEYPAFLEVSLPNGEPAPLEQWAVSRALRGETADAAEYFLRRKDTGESWVGSHSFAPIRNAGGEIVGSVVTARDITRQKVAERALRQWADAFEHCAHGIALGVPASNEVMACNPALAGMLGLRACDVVGSRLPDLFAPEDRDSVRAGAAEADRVGQVRLELRMLRVDGAPFPVQLDVVSVRDVDGQARYRVATAQDIRARREAEAALRELNAKLESRVGERTSELEVANKELEAFSYSVSHDLRAPLRAIDGFSEAVLSDYGTHLPPDGARQLGLIREGAQQMGRLIDDLLTFSRLSRQALVRREVDVRQLIDVVLEELRPERTGRAVEIDIDPLPRCRADRSLLKQVWVNLLSNAHKYTRGRAPARIRIGFRSQDGLEAYYVADNGTGFDMRYADKLFRVFQRLHRAEEFEGTGVGLAIVERILSRHGGRVWVEAAVDRGATFFFTLGTEPEPPSS